MKTAQKALCIWIVLFSAVAAAQETPAPASAVMMEKIEIIAGNEAIPITVDNPISQVNCDSPTVCQITWAQNGREIRIRPTNLGNARITVIFEQASPLVYPVAILPVAAQVRDLIEDETFLPAPTVKSEVKGTHLFVRGAFQSVYELDEVLDFLDRHEGSNFSKIAVVQAGLTDEAVDQLSGLLVDAVFERAGGSFQGITPKSTNAEWGRKLVLFCQNLHETESQTVKSVANDFREDYHAPVNLVFLGSGRGEDAPKPPSYEELDVAAGYVQDVVGMNNVRISARKTGYVWVEGELFDDEEVEAITRLTRECCGHWSTIRLTVEPEQVRYSMENALVELGFTDVAVEAVGGKLYLQGSVERASQKDKIEMLARKYVYLKKFLRYQIAVTAD